MNKEFSSFKKKYKLTKWGKDLFPICRSITGKGTRKTINYIKKNVNNNFLLKAVKSNQSFFDWKIPPEWEIKEAYIMDSDNNKVCDFKENNLHILYYSSPINKILTLKQLKKNIFTIKKKPNAIPYVTSYYKKKWGFCMRHNDFKKLRNNQKYKVLIKSRHFRGVMNYTEMVIKGKSKKEILVCSYICHPSLANNELSGPLIIMALSKILRPSKYTIRLLLIPETIGAITYIAKNYKRLKNNLVAGFNLSCMGDNGPYTLISSINENTYSDKIATRIIKKRKNFKKLSFLKRGSNERQFGCQNLNLSFTTICRTRFGDYKEYHTSDDNLNFISEKNLVNSLKCILEIIKDIQNNQIFVKNVYCEPFLTKYGMIHTTSSVKNTINNIKEKNINNVISYVSKNYDLRELSKKIKIPINKLKSIIAKLKSKKIIKEYI
jgi:aminopeptidase-like protein